MFDAKKLIFLDGAMGTMLQRAGMQAGALPELLNLTDPALITDVHRQYVEAGSDMVITCTFGANEHKLAGSGHTVEEMDAMTDRDGWYFGEEAIAAGLVDHMIRDVSEAHGNA